MLQQYEIADVWPGGHASEVLPKQWTWQFFFSTAQPRRPLRLMEKCPPSMCRDAPAQSPGIAGDIKEGWGQAPSQPSTPIPRDQGALKLHRKRGQAAGTRPSSCGGPPKAHCEGREAQTEGPLGAGGPSRGTPEEGSCASCSGLARARSSPFSCSSAAFRSARSRICSFSTSTSSRTANMR